MVDGQDEVEGKTRLWAPQSHGRVTVRTKGKNIAVHGHRDANFWNEFVLIK